MKNSLASRSPPADTRPRMREAVAINPPRPLASRRVDDPNQQQTLQTSKTSKQAPRVGYHPIPPPIRSGRIYPRIMCDYPPILLQSSSIPLPFLLQSSCIPPPIILQLSSNAPPTIETVHFRPFYEAVQNGPKSDEMGGVRSPDEVAPPPIFGPL